MKRNQQRISTGGSLVLCSVLLNVVVAKQGFIGHTGWYALSVLTLPILLAAIIYYKRRQF